MAKPTYWGTRIRAVRVPDELWDAARATAKHRGETVAAVVNRALEHYVRRHRNEMLRDGREGIAERPGSA